MLNIITQICTMKLLSIDMKQVFDSFFKVIQIKWLIQVNISIACARYIFQPGIC